MADRFVVNLTHAKDEAERASLAFVVANAAAASGKETVVFLSTEGVRLSQLGYADDVHVDGFAPLAELMAEYTQAGGRIFVCQTCFKKYGLDEGRLVGGASVAGSAALVEFMSGGVSSVSF
jgi:predicted peroxiredoxin